MNLKSLFCNHDYKHSEIVLPNGQKRIKETCDNCGKSRIYCLHKYEIINKTYQDGQQLNDFNGSMAAFDKIQELLGSHTEILFKCSNCGNFHKETLKGKEIN